MNDYEADGRIKCKGTGHDTNLHKIKVNQGT